MLYYAPLESYSDRYTQQWSGAGRAGWQERRWLENSVKYLRVNGPAEDTQDTGEGVVNPFNRAKFCFAQISELLDRIQSGQLTSDDVIYFDDFWTPGIEALFYACDMRKIHPRMYAYCHAQSVDEYDFTYGMLPWIRKFEQGIGRSLDGIFVAHPLLRQLLDKHDVAHYSRIHVTGHPFASDEVRERMPKHPCQRENKIVFSSRWDLEKNPMFFLRVIDAICQKRTDIEFVICTGQRKLRSNNHKLLQVLKLYQKQWPNNIRVRENLTKEQYYHELCTAKIQFNCASQDWLSVTLLEASVAGCYPIYPNFRSFPLALRHDPRYLYNYLEVESAVQLITDVLAGTDHWTESEIIQRSWIHRRFDDSWLRMLIHMGVRTEYMELAEFCLDPYAKGAYL